LAQLPDFDNGCLYGLLGGHVFLDDCGMMATMTNQLILNDPVGRLLQLMEADTSKRIVIGVVGLPGSGKSTLAAKLVEAVNQSTHSQTAVALSMDGFHLSKAALAQFADPIAALQRRGAPWTFDPAGLADKLQKIRKIPDKPTTWPAFEHGVGDPVDDVIVIPPETKLIIVEGLYLLHREHGWNAATANISALLDECWYLNTSMDVAMDRLVSRHMAAWGFSRKQALNRLAMNDRLNAEIVLQSRGRADYWVE
jgi:pantothenate kinase